LLLLYGKVFIAEQKAAEDAKKLKERETVLAREQDHFSRAQTSGGGAHGQLAFMYAQPHVQVPQDKKREEMEALEQARLNETRMKKVTRWLFVLVALLAEFDLICLVCLKVPYNLLMFLLKYLVLEVKQKGRKKCKKRSKND
jgi:hypothetical protein